MLQQDASGKFFVKCPLADCGKLHLIKRNRDYKAKEQIRFRCSACKTGWYASESERKQIVEAYSQPATQKKPKKVDNQPPAQEQEEPSWLQKILS